MKYIGIIPARYQSSRFPGKILCDILGKTMIQRVYESVIQWDKWENVYVASDSYKIRDECNKIGIPVLMTRNNHKDCLDRASEAVEKLENKGVCADRYIVIQGDEPLFNVKTLNTDLSPTIINFYTKVNDQCDKDDSNVVKVVVSSNQKAIYFSRYSIPYHGDRTKRSNKGVVMNKQIGVYSFSGEMLKLYTRLEPTFLENMEGIGLNRLIENDIEIHMKYTEYDSISVDTPEDRERIISIIKERYRCKGKEIEKRGDECNIIEIREP